MANSLRAKLSKLRHDGNITEEEYKELISKLDGHDKQIRTEAIDECIEIVENGKWNYSIIAKLERLKE